MSWLPPSGPAGPASPASPREGRLPDTALAPALEAPAKQDCRPDTRPPPGASSQAGAELAWIIEPACPTPHPTDGKTEAQGGRSAPCCQIASLSMSGSCTPYPTTPASVGQRPKGPSGSPAPSTVQAPGAAEEAGGHQQHAGSDLVVVPPALCYTPPGAGSGPVAGSGTGHGLLSGVHSPRAHGRKPGASNPAWEIRPQGRNLPQPL